MEGTFRLPYALNQPPRNLIGVTEAINLKNFGMYGFGNGTFEARYKPQASGNREKAYFQQHLLL